jgi:hypothetical protein
MIARPTACAFALLALASSAAAAGYHAPRTSFGDPDLQGLWTNSSLTTLERPQGLNDLVMAPEMAAKIEAMSKARLAENDKPTDPKNGAPPAADDPGGYNSFWLDAGSKFGVVNGQIRSSWITDPADGHVPYSAKGRQGMMESAMGQVGNFDGPEVRSLGERCIVGYGSSGGPPMLNVLYNNNYQFVQTPGFVTIVVEMNHDARIVRLNARHLPPTMRPWMGDSIGHWEGDTLVVETTNFNPNQRFTADIRFRLYLSPDSKVTERFTRVAKDEILYQFRVEEPNAYTQPWSGEMPLRATKGPMYEYACHEGNYALADILAGARAKEGKHVRASASDQ